MGELPKPTAWELGDDGEVIETQVFADGTEIKVRPLDLIKGEGPFYSSEDVMRQLGFSEDIIQLYSERWEKLQRQDEE